MASTGAPSGSPSALPSRSYTAGLADRVSDRVRPRLRTAESLGLRGEPDEGLRMLRELRELRELCELCAPHEPSEPRERCEPHEPSGLRERREPPDGLSHEAGPDHVAVAELAVLLQRWGGDGDITREICDVVLRHAGDPATRATLLIARARAGAPPDDLPYYSHAFGEFAAAGDARGRALALGRMAAPTDDGSRDPANEDRARLGRQGLELAIQTGDPYTIAVCAGNLAACETHLGRAGALRRWRQAVRLLPPGPDTSTAEQAAVHHTRWALAATAHGDFAQAGRALDEGRSVTYAAPWIRGFDAVEAVLLWRRGELTTAARVATRAAHGGRHWSGAIAAVVHAAVGLERDRRLGHDVDEAVREAVATGDELGSMALAVQARIRAVRREPRPCRDLAPALAEVRRRRLRFGWEDMLLALTQIDPELAAQELPRMGRLWPPGDRSGAIREFVTGVIAGPSGFGRMLAAAAALHRIGETVTAGQAYHAAAGAAASVAEGNRLRGAAIRLLQNAGADRSLAAVVRDRTLHRGPNLVPVPDSQRYQRSPGLTPREHQVAVLAAQGLTAAAIAENLGISLGTARNHLLSVRQKFGGVPKRELAQLLSGGQPLSGRCGKAAARS